MNKILNFGSLNIDKTYSLGQIVRPGETTSAISYEEFIGGKGLNQSVALKRAGADVYHAGLVGEDGDFLLEFLNENDINSFVKKVSGPSGHAIIQIDVAGNNAIIVEAGANKKIEKAYIDEVFTHFAKGDYLLIQNEINNLPYIVEAAKTLDMKVCLNPSPIDEEIKKIDFSAIDLLIINEIEGKSLSGFEKTDEIIGYFSKNFPNLELVLTLGADGGVYFYKDKRINFQSVEVEVIDTTAAGDTFLGYFLAAKALGKDISEALEIASLVASLACCKKGASASIPTRAELKDFKRN